MPCTPGALDVLSIKPPRLLWLVFYWPPRNLRCGCKCAQGHMHDVSGSRGRARPGGFAPARARFRRIRRFDGVNVVMERAPGGWDRVYNHRFQSRDNFPPCRPRASRHDAIVPQGWRSIPDSANNVAASRSSGLFFTTSRIASR